MITMFEDFIASSKALFGADKIPLHQPVFKGNERKYVLDTLDTTFVSSVGEYVNKTEKEVALRSECGYAIATVNGTAALQIALKVTGVQPGDEVLTQAMTFVATANAINYVGAHPVFIDVDLDTMGFSPSAMERFLETHVELRDGKPFNKETNRRISACLPMHTFGFMVDLDTLRSICDTWAIPIIEDAAEAFGSSYKGKPAGSIGKTGTISFNGNKVITSGGGGMVLTSDETIAKHVKHLTTTAKTPHSWEYIHDEVGYNFRLPNLNAALLLGQLEQLDQIIDSKREIFSAYKDLCDKIGLSLKTPPADTEWNHWLMAIELKDLDDRNAFLEATNAKGVMTRPVWRLLFELPMFTHCLRDDQVNARYFSDRIVNIPSNWTK